MNLNKIVVIGAGTMGAGIADWFLQQNCLVELADLSQDQLDMGQKKLFAGWNKLLEKKKLTAEKILQMKESLKICHFNSGLENRLSFSQDADLVIEAIVENLEIKQNLFSRLDQHFHQGTLFSSNTSSLSIGEIGKTLTPQRRSQFLGLHFFNPAPVMKLVEIIKAEETQENLAARLYEWFDSRGKKPALCKDSPGFIVNRVARNFYGEPLRIVDEDNPTKMREVDRVLKEVGGFRMGPFELMDLIGIDVNYSVTCSVWNAYEQEPRFAPHHLQEKMVDEKRYGRKTQRGFFKYD